MESYHTLGGVAEGRVVEKKSEFLAAAAPAQNEQHALDFLEGIRAAHRTASHNVYAYSLRQDARQRYSDDGEPAKTAGLPVLGVIQHSGLVDCIIVVTRYFGGTLLGTGGLVRAYTAAAQNALAGADILTVRRCLTLTLTLDYAQYEPVRRLLEAQGARVEEPAFTDKVQLQATLPAEGRPPLEHQLNELLRGEMDSEWSNPFFLPF